MLKRLHKVSLSKWKKATLFQVDFLWAFPLKPPCVLAIEDWSVCMGKCTSTVSLPNQIEFRCRVCVFPRSKKCSIPSLCNWRMGRGAEAWRLGIRERWVCFSRISLLPFFLGYVTQLSPNVFHKQRSSSASVPSLLRDHLPYRCIFVTYSATCTFIRREPRYLCTVLCVWVSYKRLIDGLLSNCLSASQKW